MSRRVKFTDLEPSLATDGRLVFWCPSCPAETHLITCYTRRLSHYTGQLFDMVGLDLEGEIPNFSKVTLTPNVNPAAYHPKCRFNGWVTKGIVSW
jgi:hypothetical protein